MEVQGYVLEGIPKLRCLSITEIVLGVIGAIGLIANLSRSYDRGVSGSIGSLFLVVLLIAAGSLGIYAINQARSHIVTATANTFRFCGILNMVLCVLYCIDFFLIVLGGILLAAYPAAGVPLLENFGIIVGRPYEDVYDTHFRWAFGWGTIVLLVVWIVGCVLMILLTATAAKIARRNQVIITAGPRGAVAGYPSVPAGYIQYSTVMAQGKHHA